MNSDWVICDACRRALHKHESFVVRMDVFADPSAPELSKEDLEREDFDATFNELMEEMNGMSADDLQDGVHRRFEFRLCFVCHRQFLANPMGKPRELREGKN